MVRIVITSLLMSFAFAHMSYSCILCELRTPPLVYLPSSSCLPAHYMPTYLHHLPIYYSLRRVSGLARGMTLQHRQATRWDP